jgi:hypothetical protein
MISAKWQCSLLDALALPLVAGLIVAGFQFCDIRPAELYTVYFQSLGVLAAIALLTLGNLTTQQSPPSKSAAIAVATNSGS